MTKPLAAADPNSQDPHDSNALPTKKRPVTVPSLDHEQYSVSSPGTHIVSNMRDTNSSAPLFDSCCLSSPLQTLALTLESSSNGCITIVDVAQAYQTLYNRLRASTNLLIGRNETEAEQLRSTIPTLVQCLKRDMSEGLKFFSHALPTSSAKHSSTELSFSGIEDPEIQTSIDSSLLCQAALNVVSALLVLPALIALLSNDDKTTLLRPIVEMCIEHSLPIFDHKRIQYLAFSCLRSEVACSALTSTQREGLSTALNRTLDSHESVDAQLHALKNIQAFIWRSPSRFAGPCSPILLKILALLQTSSGMCRIEVVKTLCAFAVAKFHILDALPDTVTDMANSAHEFLGKQKSRKRSASDEHLLPAILKDAIKGDGAIWSLTTLASLVILGDAHIFSQPRSLKLVFDALRYSSRHKISGVASLHAEVWKCLIWALSRSFSVQEEVDIEARQDTFRRAFQMLSQEMRPTVGTCLVAVLMQDHPAAESETFRTWNAGEAVKIIKQLVKQTSSRHFLEGYALLQHMVGGKSSPDGASSGTRPSDFVCDAMINGSWLSSSPTDLEETLKVPHPFSLSHIRPFSEVEVQAHWGDLSESWATSVEYFQSSPATEVLDDLTEIWQALILSQAHLTQSQSRLAASSPFAANFASLILRSLSAAAEPDERVRQIGLVRRWWNVLKNVFDPPWLSVPAGIVLTGLLDKKVDLGVDKVEDAWMKLCFELVSTNIPTFLHFLHTRVAAEGKEGPETPSQYDAETRLLWAVYVRHCVQVGSDQSWTDLAALLSLPFHCDTWVLSARESGTWGEGLAVMLLAAKQDSVDELNATQHLIEQVNDDKRDSVTIALFEAVLSASTKNFICRQIVRSLDDRLLEWYSARNTAVALRAMGALGRFWRSEEPSELISSVSLVQKGLSSWLQDSQAHMSNVEHAKMVDLAFIPVMECLSSSVPNDTNTLTTLETLFMSVFAKPSPLGADSLLSFFRSHVLRLPNLRALCPERLFTAVKSYADLCNEPLEGDNSILTPSSPSTVISDSQSPQKHILPHEYSHFGEFQSPVHGPEAGNSPEIVTTPKPTATGMPSGPSSSSPVARRGVELPQGIVPPSPNVFLGSPEIPVASVHRVPKRHHTGGYFEIPDSETIESPRPLKRTKTMPLPRPMGHNRNVDDRHLVEVAPTSSPLPPSSDPAPELELRDGDEEDDYDSWEAGISHKDIQDLRNELNLEGEVLEDVDSYILHDSSSPSPTRFPFRSRMRERSQTAPEPDPQSPLLDETEPFARGALRRHHTSGSFEHEDNTQLKAVRHAYATVVDSGGVSQMGIEELMQMKRLTSRIGQTVDEHIEQQLEKEGRLTGPSGRERSRTPL